MKDASKDVTKLVAHVFLWRVVCDRRLSPRHTPATDHDGLPYPVRVRLHATA